MKFSERDAAWSELALSEVQQNRELTTGYAQPEAFARQNVEFMQQIGTYLRTLLRHSLPLLIAVL